MKAVRNLLIYIFSTYLLVMFGFNAAQDFWCSTLVKGVIYGSYSVSEMFPKNFTNCTWTLENPDPTKYSIYLKFSKKDFSCSNFSLLAYQFDHFSHEKIKDLLKNNHSIMQLCNSKNAFVFLQYDKNFIQIRRVYPTNFPGLHKKEEDQKSFFEFLVLNKVSPSQFGCHVLCTWLESCLKSENGRTESCGIMYTKCTCPQHLGEWGIDDQSLVLLNNVVLPLNEQTEGCLTQELQTTQVCNLTREAKRPPKEGRRFLEGGLNAMPVSKSCCQLPLILTFVSVVLYSSSPLDEAKGLEKMHTPLYAAKAAFSFLNWPNLQRIVLLSTVETPHK